MKQRTRQLLYYPTQAFDQRRATEGLETVGVNFQVRCFEKKNAGHLQQYCL